VNRAHELDEYTGPNDAENAMRLERDITSGNFALDKVLAGARINGKAVRLRDAAHNDLGGWVRHLCESRGIEMPHLPGPESSARWLRKHVNAIAADETAGEFYKAVVDLVDGIRHVVNRPEPPQFCGPCTTELTDEQRAQLRERKEDDRTHCTTQLYARRGSDTVTCPFCKAEHSVDELHRQLDVKLNELSFTITELVDVVLPKLNCHVKRRYLQYQVKHISPSGYEVNPKNHQQVDRYLFADVREKLEQQGKLETA